MSTALSTPQLRTLEQLAGQAGIIPSYHDIQGQLHRATPEALLAVLRALEVPIARIEDASELLRVRQAVVAEQGCEPVVVAWEGQAATLTIYAPQAESLRCQFILEDGTRRDWTGTLQRTGAAHAVLPLSSKLPLGYHRLVFEVGGRSHEALVIVAPRTAWSMPHDARRTWGVFAPLYALHSTTSLCSGDFADLEKLMGWVQRLGGSVVATLPLLAVLLDEPFEPSPYAPASRLFWNAFFVNLPRVDEFTAPSVQALVRSAPVATELAELRSASLVDYHREMALKRRVLREMATIAWASSTRRGMLDAWMAAHPDAEPFARFMATCERRRAAWHVWPAALREGRLSEVDYDPHAVREHLYMQWLAHEQLNALSQQARQGGCGLYLDLPLGVHPDGFDVWREQALFALDASAGAPPDDFFSKGQDWGFPPMRPEAMRAQGYRYVIAYLRHHLRHAGVLRIDHVMGLHRMFWVPRGCGATDGVYVRSSTEELYAILTLESQRHRALIVGEDLGTVPDEVRPMMAEHGLLRMSVAQFELTPDPHAAVRPIPSNAVVCVTTHDTPTFAAAWNGLDMQERIQRGLLTEQEAVHERTYRESLRQALLAYLRRERLLEAGAEDVAAVFKGLLAHLARSESPVLLISVEDLWGEVEPQNRPGTWREFPNWRRKFRHAIDALSQRADVLEILKTVAQIRR